MAPVAKPPPARYQLLVTLADSAPLVWRRLSVPNTITLAKLHRVLQAAMGHTSSYDVGSPAKLVLHVLK